MKKEFSKEWKASKQARKQRKYRANAPLNVRQKFLSANLSKDLRKKLGRRNIEVRKGDTIKVMNGEFKKRTGKVSSVDMKRTRATIEGLQRKKKDGTKINVYFHPSNLQILEMKEDKFRLPTKKLNQGSATPIRGEKEKLENKPKEEEKK